ncbi:MAG: hypothetical protein ACE14L_11760 [Terriglobales bacterium]
MTPTLETVARLLRDERLWFAVTGVAVGLMLNIALHARVLDLGGMAGGLLAALLIYTVN